jgi:hypothetical protein
MTWHPSESDLELIHAMTRSQADNRAIAQALGISVGTWFRRKNEPIIRDAIEAGELARLHRREREILSALPPEPTSWIEKQERELFSDAEKSRMRRLFRA